jgi:hypothetical protein
MGQTPHPARRWRSFFGFRPYMRPHRFALLIILPALLVVDLEASQPFVSGIRCLVLERYDLDPATWRAMATLGANLVALAGPPSPEADRAAAAEGLAYLAFLTSDEIPSFVNDPARVAEARAESNLAGFYFWDASVPAEGFTTPEVQQRSYMALKGLFPGKLVLYPTRLDPIVWSPDFLDGYFRPEFTDLVTPYYYPVGTTFIGQAREQDDWQARLASLLAALAPRIPAGKRILPVLQGYEQQGYPVGTRFPAEQLSVYRQIWPALADAAFDGWELPGTEPLLVELGNLPTLQKGVCSLFAFLAGPHSRCRLSPTLAWR